MAEEAPGLQGQLQDGEGEATQAMTIQEAVERCIGIQYGNIPPVFNIYDETPGTIPGLLYGNCDIDNLVVHMFNLDMFNYDVKKIKSEMRDWLFNPEVGILQRMVVDIFVKNFTKERSLKDEFTINGRVP